MADVSQDQGGTVPRRPVLRPFSGNPRGAVEIGECLFIIMLLFTILSMSILMFAYTISKAVDFKKYIGDIPSKIKYLDLVYPNVDTNIFSEIQDKISKKINNTEDIKKFIYEYTPIDPSGNKTFGIKNISTGYEKLKGLTIKTGRFFNKNDLNNVCIITEKLSKKLFLKNSDTLTYDNKKFKIIGIINDNKPFDINISDNITEIYFPDKIKHQVFKNGDILNIRIYFISDNNRKLYSEISKIFETNNYDYIVRNEYTSLFKLKLSIGLGSVFFIFLISILCFLIKNNLDKFVKLTYKNINMKQIFTFVLVSCCLGIFFANEFILKLISNPDITLNKIILIISIIILFSFLYISKTIQKLRTTN